MLNSSQNNSNNSMIISVLLLCIASGYLNAYTFISCYEVFGGFMTATTIICFFDIAKNSFGIETVFRLFAIAAAFAGGACGTYVLQHLKQKKIDETKIFRKMLTMQTYLMTFAVVIGIACQFGEIFQYDVFLFSLIGIISFVMGFNHHHQSTKIGNVAFKTYMMTGNVWNMLNESMCFIYSTFRKRKDSAPAQESIRRAMFILFIFSLFVIGAICGSIVTLRASYLAIIVPWFLFVIAAIFCHEKFAI